MKRLSIINVERMHPLPPILYEACQYRDTKMPARCNWLYGKPTKTPLIYIRNITVIFVNSIPLLISTDFEHF